MAIDLLWFTLVSEMFVNLAAAAIAAAAVVLNCRSDPKEDRRVILIFDFVVTGVCLLLAFWFRKVGI